MSSEKSPKILFLTTRDPAKIKPEWPFYQNWTLPQVIRERGANVSIRCWQDSSLTTKALSEYDVITFLWCNNYHNHASKFVAFIQEVLLPAQKISPKIRIVNDPKFILWNVDKKIYLPDLEKEGFLIPETMFLDALDGRAAVSELANHLKSFSPKDEPIVLKPSISGSSKQTHLIRNPLKLNEADISFLESVVREGVHGSLIIQKYETAIEKGEYSMIFIDENHTHTMLKTPGRGDFRVQHEFGGGIQELDIDKVPPTALSAAIEIVGYMRDKFGNDARARAPEESILVRLGRTIISLPSFLARQLYRTWLGKRWLAYGDAVGQYSEMKHDKIVYVRVDGVVRENGNFVLMEVEAIEPHLWLETSRTTGCREQLYRALLGF